MRLWSIHPEYLDAKGLVALWREGLLALAVLKGNTRGYKKHPQLKRFLLDKKPLQALLSYLWFVYDEALKRGYHFDSCKLGIRAKHKALEIHRGQLEYEMVHLKNKLITRDLVKYEEIRNISELKPHPLFLITEGDVEDWEKVK